MKSDYIKCPKCGSNELELEHHDEDIDYADGVMAAEWTEVTCNKCDWEWTLGTEAGY